MIHKVKLHENARKHEHLAVAKKMINKALFRADKIDKRFDFPLTGVRDIDIGYIKRVVNNSVLNYSRLLIEELDINEEAGCFEFNSENHQLRLNWIKDLRSIIAFIDFNYIVNVRTNTLVFSEGLSNEQKRDEYINHYIQNPLLGFNKVFKAVYLNGEEKRLYILTLHIDELTDVVRIETDYE